MKFVRKYISIFIVEWEQLLLVSWLILMALELLKTGLVTNYYNLVWHSLILLIFFILDIFWVRPADHMAIKKIPLLGLLGGFLVFVLGWVAVDWPWYFIVYLSLLGWVALHGLFTE
ncbi:MAG: hypothetical protein ACKKL5_02285 [Candidatus Komeilibacteria bacterium]